MFKIYFENSAKVWKNIGSGTEQDCRKSMAEFLKEHKFKSYYNIETSIDVGVKRIDVGSHTEFFYLIDLEKATYYGGNFECAEKIKAKS